MFKLVFTRVRSGLYSLVSDMSHLIPFVSTRVFESNNFMFQIPRVSSYEEADFDFGNVITSLLDIFRMHI